MISGILRRSLYFDCLGTLEGREVAPPTPKRCARSVLRDLKGEKHRHFDEEALLIPSLSVPPLRHSVNRFFDHARLICLRIMSLMNLLLDLLAGIIPRTHKCRSLWTRDQLSSALRAPNWLRRCSENEGTTQVLTFVSAPWPFPQNL
jgi:hypothetical protein